MQAGACSTTPTSCCRYSIMVCLAFKCRISTENWRIYNKPPVLLQSKLCRCLRTQQSPRTKVFDALCLNICQLPALGANRCVTAARDLSVCAIWRMHSAFSKLCMRNLQISDRNLTLILSLTSTLTLTGTLI